MEQTRREILTKLTIVVEPEVRGTDEVGDLDEANDRKCIIAPRSAYEVLLEIELEQKKLRS